MQPRLAALSGRFAPALVDDELDIVGGDVLQRIVQLVEPRQEIVLVRGVRAYAVDREHCHDAVAFGQHDVIGDMVLERDLVAEQRLECLKHWTRPRRLYARDPLGGCTEPGKTNP
jgi:hypothetical protein